MPREHPSYRASIEQLNTLYPSKEVFSLKELCAIMNLSRKTVKKHYLPDGHQMSKVNLAKVLANIGGDRQ